MTLRRRLEAIEDRVELTPRVPPPEAIDAMATWLHALASGAFDTPRDPICDPHTFFELKPALEQLTLDELRFIVAELRKS